jgi:Mor family transcriptional regulator
MTHTPEMKIIENRRMEYIRNNSGKSIKELMKDLRLSYHHVYALRRKSQKYENSVSNTNH